MGNPEDAADGLQDGMIAAFRRAGSFRGEAAVTTWLHRVVVNACLDRLRAAKIRRLEALPDDVEDRGTLVATAVHDDQPEAAAEDAERRRRVLGALATLPRRPARGARAGRHGGLPRRRGGRDARLRRGHREVALLARSRPSWPGSCSTSTARPVTPPHGNPPPDGPVQPTVRPRGPPAP